jgi:ankyrin repeat protein
LLPTSYKEVAKLLLAKSANIHARDNNSETALHRAVAGGQTDIVKMLINNGADVNTTNKYGYTPLLTAASYNYKDTDLAELQLVSGADVYAENCNDKTALDIAEKKGYREVEKLIIQVGGDQ